jgi:hypothetical protein
MTDYDKTEKITCGNNSGSFLSTGVLSGLLLSVIIGVVLLIGSSL